MADTPDPEIEFRDVNNHHLVDDDRGDGRDIERDIHDRHNEEPHLNILNRAPPRRYLNFDDGDHPGFGTGQKRLTLKPEAYSGLEDWEEYLSHFELCAELGHWRGEDKRLALAASLRGSARTFYMSLPLEDKHNYEYLVQQLGQRFGSTRQYNRWLSKLEMRKRLPDESIATLSDDLRQMSQRAYPHLDARAQEAIALNQLYKCVSLEMKCRCIDKECTTVSHAVEIIERYEAVMGEPQEKKKPAQARGVAEDGQATRGNFRPTNDYQGRRRWNNRSSETVQLSKAIEDLTSRLNHIEGKPQSSTYPRSRRCYICNSTDHFFKDCPIFNSCQEHLNRPSGHTTAKTNQQREQQGNDHPSSH